MTIDPDTMSLLNEPEQGKERFLNSGRGNLPRSWKIGILAGMLVLLVLASACERRFSPDFDIVAVHALKGQIFAEPYAVYGSSGNLLSTDSRGPTVPADDSGEERHLGFSLLSSQIRQLRQSRRNLSIFMADNNTIHGTPEVFFSEGRTMVDLLNLLGLDLLVIDSREYYYGQEALASIARQADFPLVSANIRMADGLQPPSYLHPYYYNPDINLLIIGLSSPSLITRNLPMNVEGLTLIPSARAVREALEQFKRDRGMEWDFSWTPGLERPFIVVNAVSHKLSRTGQESRVADFEGLENSVDLLMLGERDLLHDGLVDAIGTGENDFGEWQGRLILVDDLRSDKGGTLSQVRIRNTRVMGFTEHEISSAYLKPDESIAEQLFRIREESRATLMQVLSMAEARFDHSFSGDSPLSGLVADSMRAASAADLALINSGAVRDIIPAGRITLYDAYRILPFDSSLYTLEMSGQQILELLNSSAERFLNPETEKGFLQGSGISFIISDRGGRYVVESRSVRINSEPLDPSRKYRVAITSYLYAGGDGYTSLANLPIVQEYQDTLLTLFIRYLGSRESIAPDAEPRIGIRIN